MSRFGIVKYIKVLTFLTVIILCESLKLSSINKIYQKGVNAYSRERWSQCIVEFEESLHLYKLYRGVIINCRLKCNSPTYESHIKENIEDLQIYERFFNKKDCLTKCQEQSFEDVHLVNDLPDTAVYNMQARKPYEYLHLCYFQMNAIPKAATAAYTFLVANPDDESMKNNLKYYFAQPEVDISEVVDLESDDYTVLYKLGIKAYKQSNWADTVANMEEVLTDYYSSENNCRMECERQPEQQPSIEFIITISNNIASLLHCRQQCQDKLKSLEYNSGLEFLADVLNYLQISYYHLERYEDAAKAVESYLNIMPHDEDMLENKRIYSSLIPEKAFIERSDVVYYLKRDGYEKQLLNLFHQENNNSIDTNSI